MKTQRKTKDWFVTSVTLLLFAASLGLTLLAWQVTRQHMELKEKQRFEAKATEVARWVKDRMHSYDDILAGCQGLFAFSASKLIGPDEWAAYVRVFDIHRRFRGIQAVRYIEKVSAQEGDRKEHFVVKYVEPSSGNEKLMGLDVGRDPVVRRAFEKSGNTARPIATGRIFIPDGEGESAGFLIVMPIYEHGMPTLTPIERQRALAGFADLVIQNKNFFPNVIPEEEIRVIDGSVAIYIYEEGDAERISSEKILLYESDPLGLFQDSARRPFFSKEIRLGIFGRIWNLHLVGVPELGYGTVEQVLPLAVLAGGVVFTFLVFGILYLINTGRRRAVQLAEKMTQDLRQSERFLASALNALSAHIAILDETGKIISVNESWRRFQESSGLKDESGGVGGNFVAYCESATGEDSRGVLELAKGIRLVMIHENYEFHTECSRTLAGGKRWFSIKVTRFERGGKPRIVVACEDITSKKLAEEALKASEVHSRTIVESANDAFIEMDDRGFITDWNRQAEFIFGWKHEEAMGQCLAETIIPPSLREAHEKGWRRFQATGEGRILNKRIEITALHRDGHEFPVELTVWPIQIGQSLRFNAFIHDISARKRAERYVSAQYAAALALAESEELHQACPKIFRVMSENLGWEVGDLWTVDLKAGVLLCNLFWHSPSVEVSEFETTSHQMTFAKGIGLPGRVWESGQPAWIVDVVKDPNFPRAPYAVQSGIHGAFAFPIRAGSECLGVMEFFSLTVKEPEEDLLKMMETLGHQLGLFILRERSKEELRRARDAALEASRAKSDFLATMSHEIRTPMNAIIGMADLLEETSLNLEQQEYVRIFKSAGDTLLNLINDILDLAKVESGSLELEDVPFNIRDIIERSAELMALRAHEKGLELAYYVAPDVPGQVIGDPHRLRQMLINLIGNAVKFTEQGEVVLEVKLDSPSPFPSPSLRERGRGEGADSKCRLLFSVRDTGIGIPKNKLDSIFESFVQGDPSLTRKYGGTGLGLAITRRLAEMTGGKIWVESQEGKGSTFYFTVELGVSEAAAEAVPAAAVDLKDMRVLVIDDNATNRLILKEMVSSWDAVVSTAESGELGIKALREAKGKARPYELLLLDCRMPGQDGFQVAEEIKRDPGLADIVIMMLTSESRYGDISRARKIGLSGYVMKPIKRDELLNAITLVMGQAKVIGGKRPFGISPEVPVRPLKILFAEDSLDNQLLVKAYFKNLPYQLDIAENGREAVDKFKTGSFDLVLMDVQMPVMDGYAAVRLMRQWERDEKKKPAPVIALTAHAFKMDEQRCQEAGFSAYLTKPVKKARLLEVVRHEVKEAEARKAA